MSQTTRAFMRCVRILTVEQFREPIAVFWSLLAPVAFLALSAHQGRGFMLSGDQWTEKLGMGLSYVAITMSFFTFGMYLIGRRESGFVRSFLTGARRRQRFVLVQYMASYMTLLAYGAVFGAIAALLVEGQFWKTFMDLYGRFAMFGAGLMFGTIFVAVMPLTFQAASSAMSIVLMVIVVSGLAAAGLAGDQAVRYFNVFNSGAEFITFGWGEPALLAVLCVQFILAVVLGCAGLRWQRVNPEWSNR